MRASIIKIGNSSGVRIPKSILQLCRLEGEVEMNVENGRLVIAPLGSSRAGWEEAMRELAAEGDDRPLIDDALDDSTDWRW